MSGSKQLHAKNDRSRKSIAKGILLKAYIKKYGSLMNRVHEKYRKYRGSNLLKREEKIINDFNILSERLNKQNFNSSNLSTFLYKGNIVANNLFNQLFNGKKADIIKNKYKLTDEQFDALKSIMNHFNGLTFALIAGSELSSNKEGKGLLELHDVLLKYGEDFVFLYPSLFDNYSCIGPFQLTSITLYGKKRKGKFIEGEINELKTKKILPESFPVSVLNLNIIQQYQALYLSIFLKLLKMIKKKKNINKKLFNNTTNLSANILFISIHTLPSLAGKILESFVTNNGELYIYVGNKKLSSKELLKQYENSKNNNFLSNRIKLSVNSNLREDYLSKLIKNYLYFMKNSEKIFNQKNYHSNSIINLLISHSKHIKDYYVVKRGDTLYKIAGKFGVSVSFIKRFDFSSIKNGRIYPGEILIITVPHRPNINLVPKILEKSKNRGGIKSRKRFLKIVHRVHKNETLSKIANRYGVSVKDLKQWNNLKGDIISTGRKIYIYLKGYWKYLGKVKNGDTYRKLKARYKSYKHIIIVGYGGLDEIHIGETIYGKIRD